MLAHRVGHRHVDPAPLPRPLRAQHGGQRADRRGLRAAELVGDLQVAEDRAAVIGRARLVDHAGQRQVVQVVPGRQPQRPLLPVAADAGQHDGRIDRPQRLVAQAEPLHHAGPEAFDDRMRLAHQRAQAVELLGLLQVEHQPALAVVDDAVEVRDAVLARPHVRRVIARQTGTAGQRRLDLEHLRAQIGQMPAGHRPGQQPRQVQHAQRRQHRRAAIAFLHRRPRMGPNRN